MKSKRKMSNQYLFFKNISIIKNYYTKKSQDQKIFLINYIENSKNSPLI